MSLWRTGQELLADYLIICPVDEIIISSLIVYYPEF